MMAPSACTASRSSTPSLSGSATATALTSPRIWRKRTLAELTLALVHEHMEPARSVDDRGVGIAVAVQISPGKAANARNSGKRMNVQECAIAVVAQNGRNAAVGPEYDIEVAIRLDVHRPGAGVRRINDRLG